MKKKKDVLLLLQFFYPEYISSATLPFDTAKKLAEEGFSVDALCGYPYEYTDKMNLSIKETVENINIQRVKYLQLDKKTPLGRMVNYLSLTLSMLFRLLKMKKYKMIIAYSNPPILPLVAALASKFFKCKLIFVAYDLYPEVALKTQVLSNNSFVTKLMNFINKLVYKQAVAVVALSSEMKTFIVENRNISADKVYIIPNWYEDLYQQHEKNDNPFISIVNERFAIGYFGNMGIAQDMEPIKAAMRYFKNDSEVCFLLSGHGLKYKDIEKMIYEEKIQNAYLYGFLKGQDYLNVLYASNCAIVSLKKGLTGLCVPSKTYGYMMQGLPIIAIMDESDIVKDVQKGAGYYVSNNCTKELIAVIAEMKNNRQECLLKGKMSRQLYLENYTSEVCLEKYVQLVRKVLFE